MIKVKTDVLKSKANLKTSKDRDGTKANQQKTPQIEEPIKRF